MRPPGMNDHPVPGLPGDPHQWVTRFPRPPDGMRPVNLHLRNAGRANTRYAVLFRDFLTAHPLTTASNAEAKRRFAAVCNTTAQYADAKDPICDLIYLPAEEWAESTGWQEPWKENVAGSASDLNRRVYRKMSSCTRTPPGLRGRSWAKGPLLIIWCAAVSDDVVRVAVRVRRRRRHLRPGARASRGAASGESDLGVQEPVQRGGAEVDRGDGQ